MPTFLRRIRYGLWRFYRRPLAVLAAAAALGAGAVLTGAASDDVGPTVVVAVAATDVPAGSTLTAADVRSERRPVREVPTDAIVTDPAGRVAATDLLTGEAIAERRLAPLGIGAVTALLPTGTVGVTVPVDGTPPGLAVGERLDLLTIDIAARARVVASGATVVAIDDRSATVAVPAELGPEVVSHLVRGALVPVLAPAPGT